MKKREKRPITYGEAHNKAVRMFKRSSIFLLWAGIVNLFAVIIGVIQSAAGSILSSEICKITWPTSGYALSFSIQIFLNSLLVPAMDPGLAYFLMLLIAAGFSALFVFIGLFASKGRLGLLIAGGALYALDFVGMFFVYGFTQVPAVWTNYAFTLATHAIIFAAVVVAIIEYYNVIHIEKIFKGAMEPVLEEEVEGEVIANGKDNIEN